MRGEHKSQTQSGKRSEHDAATSAVRSGFSGEADSGETEFPEIELDEEKSGEETSDEETGEEKTSGEERSGSVRSGEFDEDDLIRRTLEGDHDAFELLVRRFSSRVFNIIGSFFRRRDMIEESSMLVVKDDEQRRVPNVILGSNRVVDASDQALSGHRT